MTNTTTPRARVPHRIASTAWSLVLPGAVALATGLWASGVRSRLPEPSAVHWGTAGPDAAGSFAELVALPLAGIVPAFALGLWALAFFLGHAALTRRIAAAVSVWTAVMISGVTATSVAIQLDAPDWTAAGSLGLGSAISVAAATLLAALAAWLSPADAPQPASAPLPATSARLPLGEHEAATWSRTVRQAGLGWLIALVVAVCVAAGVGARSWLVAAALAAALAVPVVLFTSWTVTVDRRGLSVSSRLGRPRLDVPLEEVEAVEVREVHPLGEYGGWGVRTNVRTGATGVVLRSGEGIEVHRTGGRRFVVTVDDAETGAALLTTLADRSRDAAG